MTLDELTRAINSKKRVKKMELQEKASMDYALADLIGRSMARIYNSSVSMPDISEVYPSLFDSKEIEQIKAENKMEKSALAFKAFAESFNKSFKKKKESE